MFPRVHIYGRGQHGNGPRSIIWKPYCCLCNMDVAPFSMKFPMHRKNNATKICGNKRDPSFFEFLRNIY